VNTNGTRSILLLFISGSSLEVEQEENRRKERKGEENN
jgi:hypothetical protein